MKQCKYLRFEHLSENSIHDWATLIGQIDEIDNYRSPFVITICIHLDACFRAILFEIILDPTD